MDLREVLQRCKKGENLRTEFKQWPIHSDDLAAEITAFANTDGGQIFIGIDDTGNLIGIGGENIDNLSKFVDNVAFNNCEPPVTVIQETVRDEKGNIILIINIPKGSQRPYKTNRGIYNVRTSSGRRQASREELLRLFQAAESLYYDETPIFRSTMEDLDEKALESLLELVKEQGIDTAGISRDRLLQNWHLVDDIKGEKHPTFTGVLFLAANPQAFIPYSYVSALRVPGNDISIEPIDQKHFEGRLIDIYHDIMRFFGIHLMRSHQIKGTGPEVKVEIPVEVLREAIVNAFAHRDYTISSPIRIIIYNDRIEIRTPGSLPNTVDIDALKFGVHVLRNPSIYNIFLKVGLVTDAGSGIPRMVRLLKQANNTEPDFKMEGNEFITIIPR